MIIKKISTHYFNMGTFLLNLFYSNKKLKFSICTYYFFSVLNFIYFKINPFLKKIVPFLCQRIEHRKQLKTTAYK